MPELDFQQFESDLLSAGIAPRHVRRTVDELREHLDDLVEAEFENGRNPELAWRKAVLQLGELGNVAAAMRARPELYRWSHRFPRVAVVVYPLTCFALLPAYPLIAGIAHAPAIARWGTCLLAGGLVTALIFLLLQWSISLS